MFGSIAAGTSAGLQEEEDANSTSNNTRRSYCATVSRSHRNSPASHFLTSELDIHTHEPSMDLSATAVDLGIDTTATPNQDDIAVLKNRLNESVPKKPIHTTFNISDSNKPHPINIDVAHVVTADSIWTNEPTDDEEELETMLESFLKELLLATDGFPAWRARTYIRNNAGRLVPFKMMDVDLITSAYLSLNSEEHRRYATLNLSAPLSVAKMIVFPHFNQRLSKFYQLLYVVTFSDDKAKRINTGIERTPRFFRITMKGGDESEGYDGSPLHTTPKSHSPSRLDTHFDGDTIHRQHLKRFQHLDNDYIKWIWLILDVVATVPFFVELLVYAIVSRADGGGFSELIISMYTWNGSPDFIRLLRLFRILRLLRIGQKTERLRVIWKAVVNSTDGIFLLFMAVPLFVTFFSFVLFYAEISTGYALNGEWFNADGTLSKFQSILDCFWCVIETLTTVGYGDIMPTTPAGKIVMSIVMILSLFIIAFPLCMITMQYTHYARIFSDQKKQHAEAAYRLRERLKAADENVVFHPTTEVPPPPTRRFTFSRRKSKEFIPTSMETMIANFGRSTDWVGTAKTTLSNQVPPLSNTPNSPQSSITPKQHSFVLPNILGPTEMFSSSARNEMDRANSPPPANYPSNSNAGSDIESLEIGLPITRAFTLPDLRTRLSLTSDDEDYNQPLRLRGISPTLNESDHVGDSPRRGIQFVNLKQRNNSAAITSDYVQRKFSKLPNLRKNTKTSANIGIREVERMADAQYIDTYPKTVLFKVQDWKAEYKSDKREDMLTIRVRCKDEESYRRLMRLLADFS
ncbi:UNVERIFIED_CONTAM: Potassium voltage-gated channel sub C member 4 [Siphonaria sp. JEL0065]|nr:Potassium voltage-gated channel sub C member 4 [Siphonaria sp. JEL0065]